MLQVLNKIVLDKILIAPEDQLKMAQTHQILELEQTHQVQQPEPKIGVETYQLLRQPNQLLRMLTQTLTEQLVIT